MASNEKWLYPALHMDATVGKGGKIRWYPPRKTGGYCRAYYLVGWAITIYHHLKRKDIMNTYTSYASYATPQDMLDAYYDGQIDFNNILSSFDECGVDFYVDDLTGMIEIF